MINLFIVVVLGCVGLGTARSCAVRAMPTASSPSTSSSPLRLPCAHSPLWAAVGCCSSTSPSASH